MVEDASLTQPTISELLCCLVYIYFGAATDCPCVAKMEPGVVTRDCMLACDDTLYRRPVGFEKLVSLFQGQPVQATGVFFCEGARAGKHMWWA